MHRTADRRDLVVPSGDVSLAGSLWLPAAEPVAILLMHPGSGPSDRDNDVFFPPIREYLLEADIAVASFDKRGVGGSTGRWEEASIVTQANDVLACCDALRAEAPDTAVGLFGHSQGGWVVLEVAAADPSVAFVVTNSGPGVTMERQERYATEAHMTSAGAPADAIAGVLAKQDALMALVRDGADFETVVAAADGDGPPNALELELVRRWLDHDPRPALERLERPLLAIFGDEDLHVPVDESIAVVRAARANRRGVLDIETLPGGDHRLQVGDPRALHPAYEPVLGDWIARVADGA
jgi:pimeloyl-ACP methyl ester carboxylesterase